MILLAKGKKKRTCLCSKQEVFRYNFTLNNKKGKIQIFNRTNHRKYNDTKLQGEIRTMVLVFIM